MRINIILSIQIHYIQIEITNFVFISFDSVQLTSVPSPGSDLLTSPTDKDPFPQIDAFVQKVNASQALSSRNQNNLSELNKNSSQIDQWYAECMEKYCSVVDSLSKDMLEIIFGPNTERFLKLKVLKQRLKAKIKINKRNMDKLELEQVQDFTDFDEPMETTKPTPTPYAFDSSLKQNVSEQFPIDDFDEFDLMVSKCGDLGATSVDLTGIEELETGSSQVSVSSVQTSQKSVNNHMGDFYSGTKNDGISGEFDGYKFKHSELMQTSLRYTFGLKAFRPNQLQAINATMLGFDCFVLMPTGGGKSLCYQLPATLTESVTIIISPLKSLILDQVSKLQALDIVARNLSGEQTLQDMNNIYRELETTPPLVKVLYVTPEKISASPRLQDVMMRLFRKGHIARFVIDEAHCVRYAFFSIHAVSRILLHHNN